MKIRQVTKLPSFTVEAGNAKVEVYTAFDGDKFKESDNKCEVFIEKAFFDRGLFNFSITERQLAIAKVALKNSCTCTRDQCAPCAALVEIEALAQSIARTP